MMIPKGIDPILHVSHPLNTLQLWIPSCSFPLNVYICLQKNTMKYEYHLNRPGLMDEHPTPQRSWCSASRIPSHGSPTSHSAVEKSRHLNRHKGACRDILPFWPWTWSVQIEAGVKERAKDQNEGQESKKKRWLFTCWGPFTLEQTKVKSDCVFTQMPEKSEKYRKIRRHNNCMLWILAIEWGSRNCTPGPVTIMTASIQRANHPRCSATQGDARRKRKRYAAPIGDDESAKENKVHLNTLNRLRNGSRDWKDAVCTQYMMRD